MSNGLEHCEKTFHARDRPLENYAIGHRMRIRVAEMPVEVASTRFARRWDNYHN